MMTDFVARLPPNNEYASAPGSLIHIHPNGHVKIHPYKKHPIPVPRINFTRLHGLLNPHVIRRLKSEPPLRVIMRMVFPFFVNDHFPGDYVRLLNSALEENGEKVTVNDSVESESDSDDEKPP